MAESVDELVDDWLTLEAAGALLGVPPSRVRQLGRELALIVVRRARGSWELPALFLDDGVPVKGLGGTIHLLHDAGFDEHEMLRWLFTPDDSLPGRPIDALRADRGKEVRRRAQATAL